MSTQPIKIQINSLEALERLIGGNTEAEMDIRNSVVQAFTERHLKSIANQEHVAKCFHSLNQTVSSLVESARVAVEQQVADKLGTVKRNWDGTISTIKLRPDVIAEIDKQVASKVNQLVTEAALKVVEAITADLPRRVQDAVSLRVQSDITTEVRTQVDAAFKRALSPK